MSDRIAVFSRYLKEQQRVDDKTCAFVVEWAETMMEHCKAMQQHMKAMEEFKVLSPRAEADLTNQIIGTVDRQLGHLISALSLQQRRVSVYMAIIVGVTCVAALLTFFL